VLWLKIKDEMVLRIKQKQKGFTVTEALIALVLLGLLTILIAPQLKVYYAQNRVKAAAEGLYDDILNARMTTIKTATKSVITFVTGSSWCYGISSDAIACVCTNAATASNCNLGITSGTSYPNTSLTLGTLTSPTTFDAIRAAPTNNGGTVTFSTTSGSTQSVMLTLSALGTSALCSGSGGNANVGGYVGCP